MKEVQNYLEKPVNVDEREVAKTLTQLSVAVTHRNLPLLSSLLFSDASIILRSAKRIRAFNKQEYMDYVAEFAPDIQSLTYSDVLVRIEMTNTAIVSCICEIRLRNKLIPIRNKRLITFKKFNGSWFIHNAEENEWTA